MSTTTSVSGTFETCRPRLTKSVLRDRAERSAHGQSETIDPERALGRKKPTANTALQRGDRFHTRARASHFLSGVAEKGLPSRKWEEAGKLVRPTASPRSRPLLNPSRAFDD
jgi:hypothetical protein